jgi:ABC-type uncharacterized transport system permease subunit
MVIFGFLDGLQFRLQGLSIEVPFHIFRMIPYLTTRVVLVGVSRRATVSASLLMPYRRERRDCP